MKFECALCGRIEEAESVYDLAEKGQMDFGCDVDEYAASKSEINVIACCHQCYYSDYFYDKTQKHGQKLFNDAVKSLNLLLNSDSDPIHLIINIIDKHNLILRLCNEYETLFGEDEILLSSVHEKIENLSGAQFDEGELKTEEYEIFYDDNGNIVFRENSEELI